MIDIISPIYVTFFEKHQPWLRQEYGGDPYAWPPIFNFARALRNFIVHHHGRVHFDNPNAAPVVWHGLTYSPINQGRQAVGGGADLGLGDMIILLAELSDELDARGCPPDP